MISRSIRDFLNPGDFFVIEVFLHQFMAIETMSVALLNHGNGLIGHLSFSINASFNDFLPVIDILIFFVKVGQN